MFSNENNDIKYIVFIKIRVFFTDQVLFDEDKTIYRTSYSYHMCITLNHFCHKRRAIGRKNEIYDSCLITSEVILVVHYVRLWSLHFPVQKCIKLGKRHYHLTKIFIRTICLTYHINCSFP